MANSRIYCKTQNCRKWSKLNADQYCPTCVTTDVEADIDCKCSICNKDVAENDNKTIGCDICNNWFHSKCVGCPDALVEFMNANGPETFLGNLIWICPKCKESSPINIKLSDDCCEVIKPTSHTDRGVIAAMDPTNVPICKEYRYGRCDGKNCKFSHPPKCLDYCRYGREGCKGGFTNCKLLHPVLCRSSLKYNKCLDQKCTLAHLKGTMRKEPHFPLYQSRSNDDNGDPKYHSKSKGAYLTYDSTKLGFLSYRQTLKERDSSPPNQAASDQSKYYYNATEYPNLPSNNDTYHSPNRETGPNVPNNNDNQFFLEVMKRLDSMQQTQYLFQQQLMAMRAPVHPPQQGYLLQNQPGLQQPSVSPTPANPCQM